MRTALLELNLLDVEDRHRLQTALLVRAESFDLRFRGQVKRGIHGRVGRNKRGVLRRLAHECRIEHRMQIVVGYQLLDVTAAPRPHRFRVLVAFLQQRQVLLPEHDAIVGERRLGEFTQRIGQVLSRLHAGPTAIPAFHCEGGLVGVVEHYLVGFKPGVVERLHGRGLA